MSKNELNLNSNNSFDEIEKINEEKSNKKEKIIDLVNMPLDTYLSTYNFNEKEGIEINDIIKNSKFNLNIKSTNLLLYQGNIVKLKIDSIQNAANTSLLGGGGIDGAIYSAAGFNLYKECKKFNGCNTGEARITKGYNLSAKTIIHTPGPIYNSKKKEKCENELINCYRNTLLLCDEYNLESIGLCCISCGIFGYPLENASKTAFHTVINYILQNNTSLKYIIFVVFKESELRVYYDLMKNYQHIDLKSSFTGQLLYYNTFIEINKKCYKCKIVLMDNNIVEGEFISTNDTQSVMSIRNLITPLGIVKYASIRTSDIKYMKIYPPKNDFKSQLNEQLNYEINS